MADSEKKYGQAGKIEYIDLNDTYFRVVGEDGDAVPEQTELSENAPKTDDNAVADTFENSEADELFDENISQETADEQGDESYEDESSFRSDYADEGDYAHGEYVVADEPADDEESNTSHYASPHYDSPDGDSDFDDFHSDYVNGSAPSYDEPEDDYEEETVDEEPEDDYKEETVEEEPEDDYEEETIDGKPEDDYEEETVDEEHEDDYEEEAVDGKPEDDYEEEAVDEELEDDYEEETVDEEPESDYEEETVDDEPEDDYEEETVDEPLTENYTATYEELYSQPVAETAVFDDTEELREQPQESGEEKPQEERQMKTTVQTEAVRETEEETERQTEKRKEDVRRKYMVLDDGLNVAKIMVIGVGGAGNNAVNRMIQAGVNTAHFVAINTDKQALLLSMCAPEDRYQIGALETKGLGAGADPEIGEKAANESKELIEQILDGVDLLFITAGMGGGTGTGAAPVIAKIAREKGCVTVAVVTKPFSFEGNKRCKNAEKGIANLEKHVDTIIIIPNDKLMEAMKPNTPFIEALRYADDTLRQGICGIADLIATPSLINLDFADVRTTLKNQGLAHMGIGSAKGENRIVEAVKGAVSSPLLETTIEGARSVIFNVTGGTDLTLTQINDAAKNVRDIVDPDANVIFGANINPELQEEVIITLIATGFNAAEGGVTEENARAYNELFAARNDEDASENRGEEQTSSYEEHNSWAPNRSYTGSPYGASYSANRNEDARAAAPDRAREQYQSERNYPNDRGYQRAEQFDRDLYRNDRPVQQQDEPRYDNDGYAARPETRSAYQAPEQGEEKQKKDLPGFVKKLFGVKKKD